MSSYKRLMQIDLLLCVYNWCLEHHNELMIDERMPLK